jgi:hypothetical protein
MTTIHCDACGHPAVHAQALPPGTGFAATCDQCPRCVELGSRRTRPDLLVRTANSSTSAGERVTYR